MDNVEILEICGIIIMFFAVVLMYVAWRNERWRKQAHRDSMELLARIDKAQEEARKRASEIWTDVNETRREKAEVIKHPIDFQH